MGKNINYGYKTEVNLSYSDAINKVKELLKKDGFGIITEIDVKNTLKNKLNVDYDNYIILGACNPPFAFKALKIERDIGLILPCNVLVYEEQGKTFVVTIKPTFSIGLINKEKLKYLAEDVENKLKNVIDTLKEEKNGI